MPDGLYRADFYLWTQQQARLLREAARGGINLPLDCENLAEEVESVGRSERRELRSRLRVVLEHLLKLSALTSPAPRGGWIHTVNVQRDAIRDLLADSPSLRAEVGGLASELAPSAARLAADSLRDHGEDDAAALMKSESMRVTEEQALGDWLPQPPAA